MTYVAPQPIRLYAAAAKIETTYGTDSVPTASANAVRLSRDLWSGLIPSFEFLNLRDDAANDSLVPLPAAPAHGQKVRLRLVWEAKGGGTTYTGSVFADADPLIQCTGYPGAFSATPTPQWTYAVVTTQARPSCTVYAWGGGNQYKIVGCRGNAEWRFQAGMIAQVTFTLEGILSALPVAAAVPATTYQAVIPPAAVSTTATVGTWSPDFSEVLFRTGNDCQWLASGNATDGLQSYDFGVAKPELQVTALSVVQGTYDPVSDLDAATSRALSLVLGTVQYNKLTLSDTGIWVAAEPTPQAYKGFTAWQIRYRATAPQFLFN